MDYKKKILQDLINKYENSSNWKDSSNSNRRIFITVEKSATLSKYFDSCAFQDRQDIEDAVKELERLNVVAPERYKDNDLLVKIFLNQECLNKAYQLLGRKPKNDIYKQIEEYLEAELLVCANNTVRFRYLKKIKDICGDKKSYKKYFEDLQELKLQINILKAIENNKDEVLMRNFSKKHFGNSKLLERKSSKVLSIYNEFSCVKYDKISDLLDSYNIVKHKGYAYIKGDVKLEINGEIINLKKLNIDISLSQEAISKLDFQKSTRLKVVTIENLTTYHFYSNPNEVVIYLGGFHNSVKGELIRKLHQSCSDAEWYHMGDIDCNGFRILVDLRKRTSVNFMPMKMGIEELERYKEECQPLTDNDKKNLNLLLLDNQYKEFHGTIKYMLDNGYKLEQESIVFE